MYNIRFVGKNKKVINWNEQYDGTQTQVSECNLDKRIIECAKLFCLENNIDEVSAYVCYADTLLFQYLIKFMPKDLFNVDWNNPQVVKCDMRRNQQLFYDEEIGFDEDGILQIKPIHRETLTIEDIQNMNIHQKAGLTAILGAILYLISRNTSLLGSVVGLSGAIGSFLYYIKTLPKKEKKQKTFVKDFNTNKNNRF